MKSNKLMDFNDDDDDMTEEGGGGLDCKFEQMGESSSRCPET